MRLRINGQMQLPPDTLSLFAVLSDFPFAFTEDLQAGGVNHQMRHFTPGGRFKTDTDRFCPLTDAAVIQTTQWNVHHGKYRINKTLRSPQGQPEYTFNHQDSRDGEP